MKASRRGIFQTIWVPEGGAGMSGELLSGEDNVELDDMSYFSGLLDGLIRAHAFVEMTRNEYSDDGAARDALEAALEAIQKDLSDLFRVETVKTDD